MHLDKEDRFHILWFDFLIFFLKLFSIWLKFLEERESITERKKSILNRKFRDENSRVKTDTYCPLFLQFFFPWTERGRKTVRTVDNRYQFCDLLSNSSLTHWMVLIKLNNPLSFHDSGSVKTLLFSCFAGLLKEIHEETVTGVQGQISKSVIGGSKCFMENTVAYHLNWDCICRHFHFYICPWKL